MKKIMLICVLVLVLCGCAKKSVETTFDGVENNKYIYDDMLYRPVTEEVTIKNNSDGDGEIILVDSKNNIQTVYITKGVSTKIKLDKRATYKVGIIGNDSNVDIVFEGLEKTGGIDETKEYQLIDNLNVDDLDLTKLIRFNNDLYAFNKEISSFNKDLSSSSLKWINEIEVVGKICSLKDTYFVPLNNFETNNSEYFDLEIGISDDYDIIYLLKDSELLCFSKVEDIYPEVNVISQCFPPFNVRYLNETDTKDIMEFLNSFDESKYEKVEDLLMGDPVEIKLEDYGKVISILDNRISIGEDTYIINDSIFTDIIDKYFN